MNYDELFAKTVDTLLSGHIICPIAYSSLRKYLSLDLNRDKVNSHLNQTGRKLSSIEGEYYYCSFNYLNNSRVKQCRDFFKHNQEKIKPVVGFINFIMRTSGDERVVDVGDEIHINRLADKLETDFSLTNELEKVLLATKKSTSAKKNSPYDRLMVFMNFFEAQGIVKKMNSDSAIYTCTGKLAYHVAMIEFFVENHSEHFPELEDKEQMDFEL